MGVAPPNATPPKGHALAGNRAFKLLFEQCRRDTVCRAAFDPAADVEAIQARLPSIKGAPTNEIFFEKLRSLMYQPSSARRIPFILSRAAAGDLAPFYKATRPDGASLYADGMSLSVICSEGLPLMDVPAARDAARATLLGDYRMRQQVQACAEWPRGKVAKDHLQPVRSDAPVLLLSGELDPVTPPQWADAVAKTLPNSLHVVIPASGHIFDGMSGVDSCLDPLILSFLDSGNIKAVDASCVKEMKPPPFVTSDTLPEFR
jgi:pimeloyl-ACP methyl ester carboxylesterase